MNRRKAIQCLSVAAVAIPLLPGCNTTEFKVYEFLPIEKKDYSLIEQLAQLILPKGNLDITTPELTLDFILTNINDCHKPADQEKYLEGLKLFHFHLSGGKPDKKIAFHKLDSEEQFAALEFLQKGSSGSESLKHFYHITKSLTQLHFTSSDYFMTNYLDFEFIPARFNGCVPV